jgi:hypothetical protein
MPAKTKPAFADNHDLTETLYRMAGLVSAIYLATDTTASDQIREGALTGIHRALEHDVGVLIDAVETGEIVVNSPPAA